MKTMRISEVILNALKTGAPVVALETAVLTHGMPKKIALAAYREMMASVTAGGALPAPVGLVGGALVVGLSPDELEALLADGSAGKAAIPDLSALAAKGRSGGTTAGATLFAARRAGIAVTATGGIGGVHRGAEETFDVSGDLRALAKFGGLVVCSGAKSLCDLPKTMETLETLGVTVAGYGTDELPAFTSAQSGIGLAHRVDTPEEAARLALSRDALGLEQAVVVANPPPAEFALDGAAGARAVAEAVEEAAKAGVSGPGLTPWILDRVERTTGGASLAANRALLNANASLAAKIAQRLCA